MLAVCRDGVDCIGGTFPVREVDDDISVTDYVAKGGRDGDRAGASRKGERVNRRELVHAAYGQHVRLLGERGDDLLAHAPQRTLYGDWNLLSHGSPPDGVV